MHHEMSFRRGALAVHSFPVDAELLEIRPLSAQVNAMRNEARMPWAIEKPDSLGCTTLTDSMVIRTYGIFFTVAIHLPTLEQEMHGHIAGTLNIHQ